MIEIKNLYKNFSSLPVLSSLSFKIPQESIWILYGPNGTGKTTLLKILTGLILPNQGTITYTALNPKTDLSFSPCTDHGFYPQLSGKENLEFFAALFQLSSAAFTAYLDELSAYLMPDDLSKPYQTYSSGMKQKLSIIRAFLKPAEVFLLDEPTRNLDSKSTEGLLRLIQNYQKKQKTFITATHQKELFDSLATHTLELPSGQINSMRTA